MKRNLTKLLSALLAMCMIVSCMVPLASAESAADVTDETQQTAVPESDATDTNDVSTVADKAEPYFGLTLADKTLSVANILQIFAPSTTYNASGMDHIEFDLYISDPSLLNGLIFFVEISSSRTCDKDELQMGGMSFSGYSSGWNTVRIPLDKMSATGTCNLAAINFFRIFNAGSSNLTGKSLELRLANVRFTSSSGASVALPLDASGWNGAFTYTEPEGADEKPEIPEENESFYTEGLVFMLNADKTAYSVTGYTGKDTDVVIPATYEGLSVIEIVNNAFSNSVVKSIHIPAEVTHIDPQAFIACDNLTAFYVDEGNPAYAAQDGVLYTKDLKTLVRLPLGYEGAFIVPSHVTSIGNYAFWYCLSLKDVVISEGVKSIDYGAFFFCRALTSITIPSTVAVIGEQILGNSNMLATIIVNEKNPNFAVYDGILYDKKQTVLYVAPAASTVGEIVIPDGVETIMAYAFSSCAQMTSVELPESLAVIGMCAFGFSPNLQTIRFRGSEGQWNAIAKGGNWDTHTGEYTLVFDKQDEPEVEISMIEVFPKVQEWTFEKNAGVASMVLPVMLSQPLNINGMTEVVFELYVSDPAALNGQKLMIEMTSSGQADRDELSTLLTLPTLGAGWNTIRIPEDAFNAEIGSLDPTAVNFFRIFNMTTLPIKEKTVIRIGYIRYEGKVSAEPEQPDYTEGLVFKLNANKTAYIVSRYDGTATEVIIPATYQGLPVTEIGYKVFTSNTNITSVRMPDTIETMGDYTFSGCTNLTDVRLSSNLKTLSYGTFYECSLLKTVELPEGLGEIGDHTFYRCDNLCDIVLPKSLKSIGGSAFAGCSELHSINLPDGLTEIGPNAFEATGLQSVVFPDSLKMIPAYIFGKCHSLTEITIPTSVTFIGAYAFQACSTLKLIRYLGSNAQWASIQKGADWNLNAADFKVTFEKQDEPAAGKEIVICPDLYQWEFTNNASIGMWLHEVILGEPADISAMDELVFELYLSDAAVMHDKSIVIELTSSGAPDKQETQTTLAFLNLTEGWNTVRVPLICFDFVNSGMNAKAFNYLRIYNGEVLPVSDKTEIILGKIRFEGKATEPVVPEATAGLTFNLIADGQAYAVVGYTGTSADVYIPAMYNGKPVLEISPTAFGGNKIIKTVTIANGILEIKQHAFRRCSSLTSISIPGSVAVIGNYAFQNCVALTSVDIPDSVKTLGSYAFQNCTALETVKLPAGLTELQSGLFFQCRKLTDVTLPETVKFIANNAFGVCDSLKSIHLPASVETIDVIAFQNCAGLTAYTVDENNPIFAAVNGVLYTKDLGTLVRLPSGYKGVFDVPSHVSVIADSAFRQCHMLTAVVVPEGVTTIEPYAFHMCSALERIELPSTVTSIGAGFVRYCYMLQSISVSEKNNAYLTLDGALYNKEKTVLYAVPAATASGKYVIPEGVEQLATSAFAYCSDITEIVFPESLVTIDDMAFEGCLGLTSVVLPKNLYRLGSYAFCDCSELTSVTISEGVKSIGWYVFARDTALKTITFLGSENQWNAVQKDVDWDTEASAYELIFEQIDEPQISGKVDIFPGEKEWIYTSDAGFASMLMAVKLDTPVAVTPESILMIDFYVSDPAVLEGSRLSIELSSSGTCDIEEISTMFNMLGVSAGWNGICIPLNAMGSWGDGFDPSALDFFRIYNASTLPVNGEATVKIARVYIRNEEPEQPAPDYTEGLVFTLNEDKTTYSVTGYTGTATEVVIPANYQGLPVTMIGMTAFALNQKITSVIIPDSVCTIGASAFEDCSALETVILPKGLTVLEYGVFFGCYELASITLPETLTSIDMNAFALCNSMKSIHIPAHVSQIHNMAFQNCSELLTYTVDEKNTTFAAVDGVLYSKDLTTLVRLPSGYVGAFTVPSHVTTIADFAFRQCHMLTAVYVSEGVAEIGSHAFYYCMALEHVEIPSTVVKIGSSIIGNCGALKSIAVSEKNEAYSSYEGALYDKKRTVLIAVPNGSVSDKYTVPHGVVEIAEGAFFGCSDLTEIALPNTLIAIRSQAFNHCFKLTSVVLPENLEVLDYFAFAGCDSLTNVTIPTSIRYIGNQVFANCHSLSTITFLGTADQWAAVTKGEFWDENTGDYELIFAGVDEPESEDVILGERLDGHKYILRTNAGSNNILYFADMNREIVFQYRPQLRDGVTSVIWQAKLGGTNGLLVQVSQDDKNWITLHSEGVASVTLMTFDLTKYVDLTKSEYIYIRIGDSAPTDGWGGQLYKDSPTELYVEAKVNKDEHNAKLDAEEAKGDGKSVQLIPTNEAFGMFEVDYDNKTAGSSSLMATITKYIVCGTAFEPVDGTGYFALEFDLYVSDPSLFDVDFADAALELTSSGVMDQQEINWKLDAIRAGIEGDVVAGWNHVTLYLVDAGKTNGDFDISNINFLRIYMVNASTEINIVFGIDNVRLTTGGVVVDDNGVAYRPDGDSYTVLDCIGTATDIVIPAQINGRPVTEIAANAFENNKVLQSIELPDTVTVIGAYAFGDCIALRSIKLPENLRTIEPYAFQFCSSLQSIELPASLKQIGNAVFGACTSLKALHIPANVKSIGYNMVVECKSLATLTVDGANESYFSADNVIYTAGGVATASASAALIGEITLPEGTTAIGIGAFRGCAGITSLIVPEGVTRIENLAFCDCSALESIVLPASLNFMGHYIFRNCTNLTTINYCGTEEQWNAIEKWIYWQDEIGSAFNVVFNYTEDVYGLTFILNGEGTGYVVTGYTGSVTELVIPETYQDLPVVGIEKGALRGFAELTLVEIPACVKFIGAGAFENCDNLKKVVFSEGLTEIGEYAFFHCVSLTEVILPDSVTMIGTSAFHKCRDLEVLSLPAGIQSIGENVVAYSTALKVIVYRGNDREWSNVKLADGWDANVDGYTLNILKEYYTEGLQFSLNAEGTAYTVTGYTGTDTEVVIPSKYEGLLVTEIGIAAFKSNGCVESILLPSSVTIIGVDAFSSCSNLTDIQITGNNPVYRSENGVLYTKDMQVIVSVPAATSGSFVIPEGVIEIGVGAFKGCTQLTNIVIPESVTTIDYDAFFNCYSLTCITIPESVTCIGDSAFGSCTALVQVTVKSSAIAAQLTEESACGELLVNAITVMLPANVVEVGAYITSYPVQDDVILDGCSYKLYSKHDHIWNEQDGRLVCADCDCAIDAVKLSAGVKVSATIWGSYYRVVGGYEVVFSGSGVIPSYSDGTQTPWYKDRESIVRIVIEDGITVIGNAAFEGMIALRTVVLPSSVRVINGRAFRDCTALKELTLPEGVTTIGWTAFYGSGIEEIRIPDSVTSLGTWAFANCASLNTVCLGKGLTALSERAFSGCTALKKIDFGTRLYSVGISAFDGCSGLETLRIPGNVKLLNNYAFRNCTRLQTVVLEEGTATVGYGAFQSCRALRTVELPSTLTKIASMAFASCLALQSVTVPSGVKELNDRAFNDCMSLTSVVLEEGVTKIGNHVFRGCTKLTEIKLPTTLKTIGSFAFYNCGLESVTIPAGVTSIGGSAFAWSPALKTVYIDSPTIAKAITSAESCGSLGSYAMTFAIKEGISSVGSYITSGFGNSASVLVGEDTYVTYSSHEHLFVQIGDSHRCCHCYMQKNGDGAAALLGYWNVSWKSTENVIAKLMLDGEGRYTLVFTGTGIMKAFANASMTPWADYMDRIERLVVEEGVMTIGAYSLYGATALTSVELPDTLTEINSNAFVECTSLEAITLPESLVKLGWKAFYGSGLKEIEIPASVTNMGTWVFAECRDMERVTIAFGMWTLGERAFSGCRKLTEVSYYAGVSFGKNAFHNCPWWADWER